MSGVRMCALPTCAGVGKEEVRSTNQCVCVGGGGLTQK